MIESALPRPCPPLQGIADLGRVRASLRALSLLLAGLALGALPTGAQEPVVDVQVTPPDQIVEVTLTDGSVLIGRIVEAGDPFRFVTLSGTELSVSVANVRTLSVARGTVEGGEYWPADPNGTRLFFGPTARPLPAGQGYLAVYEIVMPFLAFGVTNSFILSGGTPLFFGGDGGRPFWFAPKLTVFDTGKTQGALGVLAVRVEEDDFGLLYGVVTRGTAKSSVSLGVGYGYENGNLAGSPAIMVGAEFRASRSLKLLTENYFFPGGEGLVSVGPRFFGRKLSADLGLVLPVGMDESFVFPLINFVYNF